MLESKMYLQLTNTIKSFFHWVLLVFPILTVAQVDSTQKKSFKDYVTLRGYVKEMQTVSVMQCELHCKGNIHVCIHNALDFVNAG